MDNYTAWQNSQFPLTVTQGDPESISATIVLVPQDSSIGSTVSKTAAFEDVDGTMTADISLDETHLAVPGVYDYQIFENFADESPIIYPDPENCEGDCDLPTFTICESHYPVDDVS